MIPPTDRFAAQGATSSPFGTWAPFHLEVGDGWPLRSPIPGRISVRHDRPEREAMIRFQSLLLLVASLAATAALLMLMGAFVTAVDVMSVHAIAPGAE